MIDLAFVFTFVPFCNAAFFQDRVGVVNIFELGFFGADRSQIKNAVLQSIVHTTRNNFRELAALPVGE